MGGGEKHRSKKALKHRSKDNSPHLTRIVARIHDWFWVF